jgi:hypothetical protein
MTFIARTTIRFIAFAIGRATLSIRFAAFGSLVSRAAGCAIFTTGGIRRAARIGFAALGVGLATLSACFAAGLSNCFLFRFRL